MKRYFLLICLFIVPNIILAQKELKSISVRNFDLPVKYIQYPTDPLGAEYKTCLIVVNLPQKINYPNLSNILKEVLFIQGFDAVAEKGDLEVKLNVTNFDFKDPEVISTSNQNDNCALRITYHYDYQIQLINTKTNAILYRTRKLSTTGVGDMWNKGYTSKRNLDDDLQQLDKIKFEILKNVLLETCKAVGNSWSRQYGIEEKEGNITLLRVYEEDYYETYFFLAQAYKLQQIFKKVSLHTPPVQFKEDIAKFIQYNEELLTKKKNMTPKAENTIAAICYYNIGWLYFLYDNPQKAIEYGEKALATGQLKRYANNLIETSKTQISIFEKNGITSRYLSHSK